MQAGTCLERRASLRAAACCAPLALAGGVPHAWRNTSACANGQLGAVSMYTTFHKQYSGGAPGGACAHANNIDQCRNREAGQWRRLRLQVVGLRTSPRYDKGLAYRA